MRTLLILTLMLLLIACGVNQPATPQPTTSATADVIPTATMELPTVAPTSTLEPTTTPMPTVTAQAEPIPTEQLADLAATSIAALPPTSTPDASGATGFGGIDAIQVLPLTGPGAGFAVAFSAGFRSFEPAQQHYVAIYTRDGSSWREMARTELPDPDYVDPASVQQVQISSDRVWLTVDSGVGAHGSCFDLLSFDGQQLNSMLNSCSSAPGAGAVRDIDGDGISEVLLNGTDYYVTCYACGLRIFSTTVMRWQQDAFQQLQLSELPGDTPLAQINNQAVTLAQANRWREAILLMPELRSLAQGDQIVQTNIGMIEQDGQPFAEQAANLALAPLMPSIFYGDYAGMLEYLRDKPVADLFEVERSQIFGPEVQGFETNMPDYIIKTVTPTLALDPVPAPAHFLYGWALLLANPTDPQGLAEIEQAAALDPQEQLYRECVNYLKAKN